MRETWEQIKEIVAQALDLPGEERVAFVRNACGENDSLRAEVDSLLLHHDGADTLLENSPATRALSFSTDAGHEQRIGVYRVIREIGHGGMAVVFMGERDDGAFRKRVAIKVVKAGIGTEQILQRFRNERQTLAVLEHPNIVKLLDGGNTEQGLPYLVMECVEGVPIDEYCDLHRLSIADRLGLFRTVCLAVQYAHQNLVIHRDLKPANILITDEGVPQLLDFGIAKLLSPELSQTPLATRVDSRMMTPEYASPEQIRGDAVTSATDIYSLGVLLYEILTGVLPYEVGECSWREIEQLVCEKEPPRPSTRVTGEGERAKSTAEMRATEHHQLYRSLRGDLDWITMKALEKDPARRYASASEFAADIKRYLAHEPVLARPTSTVYRTRKYVRRHPVGVAASAGLVLLLVCFALAQAVQLRRITRERDRANLITGFMEGMFKTSDPRAARGNTITAREVLDKASKNIDAGLAKDPEMQAQMMEVMGNVYKDLGLFPQAQESFQRSAEIRGRILGPENIATLRSMDGLGWILNQEGHAQEAEKLQRSVVDSKRRLLGTRHLETLQSISNLAWTLDREGHYAEAEKLEREVLDLRKSLVKDPDRETAATMSNLAATLGHEGRYADAEKLKRQTLDIRRRVLGPDDPDTLLAMNNLGFTLQQESLFQKAEPLQRETLEMQSRILGPEHPDTLRSMNNLANTLVHEGKIAEALVLLEKALEAKRRVLGPEHQDTLWAMKELAGALQEDGRYSEAEKLFRETLDTQSRVLGADRPNTLSTMSNLGNVLRLEGRYSDAERLQRQTIGDMQRVLGPEHPNTLMTTEELAQTLDKEGHYEEAENLARQTLEVQRRVLGEENLDAAATAYDLACILVHRGRNDEAISWLREAVDHGLDAATDSGIGKDPALKRLHNDPRFEVLVSDARKRGAMMH